MKMLPAGRICGVEVDVEMQDGWYGIGEDSEFNVAIRGPLHILGNTF